MASVKFTLLIEAACSDEMYISTYKTKQYHDTEDRNMNTRTRNLHIKLLLLFL